MRFFISQCTAHFIQIPRLSQGGVVADIQIDDGIIKILMLDIQDPKAAAVLSAYPQARWPEITRRAIKIGLGYLKGGEQG
ncbi:MAG: hypothetical protein A4C66_10180 [Nitrospira sp. HN-bin3]|nr:MAG: hypothetical protein A4C66_10180 [Nitrospira sp. HN-bin3]